MREPTLGCTKGSAIETARGAGTRSDSEVHSTHPKFCRRRACDADRACRRGACQESGEVRFSPSAHVFAKSWAGLAVIAAVVLMVVAALAAPFVQRDVIMVGADLRALPAYAPMSRTTVSDAFMSAVNNRELWMRDPWSGDNVAGDCWMGGIQSLLGAHTEQGCGRPHQQRSASGHHPRLCGIGPPWRRMPITQTGSDWGPTIIIND